MNRIIGVTALAAMTGLAILAAAAVRSELAMQPAVKKMAAKHSMAKAGRTPVLVELFTSEGCSSCPPADKTLAQLQKDQPVKDALIIPLSEHVDYWNSIGWADPFSSKAFSARQGEYSTAFHLDTVYTPQMVVDGQKEFVGSDSGAAETAIARAAKTIKADVGIEPVKTNGSITGLRVNVTNLPAVRKGDAADVLLAITEDNLSSRVARGENAGRHLPHTAVVRRLTKIGTAVSGQNFHAEYALTLHAAWKRNDLSAVIFVQEQHSRRILGAALTALDE